MYTGIIEKKSIKADELEVADMEKYEVREMMVAMELARKRILQPYFQELGLTVGQPRILNKLFEEDRITQRELADRCRLDVASISRALDKLEDAGYLTRERHPECRRSFLVVLTASGREKAEAVHQKFQGLDQRIWQGIGEQEMESFLSCAQKILHNLE